MFRTALFIVCLSTAFLMGLPASGIAAPPELAPEDISWQQVNQDVNFSLIFRNSAATPSDPVNGALNSQEFGAFLDNIGVICNFNVPSIAPGGSHEVTCSATRSSLPPSAEVILPPGKAGPDAGDKLSTICPGPNWFGNVDVLFGPGITVNAHLAGNVPVCPGAPPTYIHILVDNCAAGTFWAFNNVCPGWTVTLLSDAGGVPGPPAPNPLAGNPPVFDGWICISANATVPVGTVCCFTMNLNCGGQTAQITIWAEACVWGTVGVENDNWGAIKGLYRDQH